MIIARVYDSAWEGPSDFSPGWRLSLSETIEALPNGRLRYVDESLSALRFENTGNGYALVPSQPSDIVSLEATPDGFEQQLRQGWRKQFKHLGGLARLTEIRDADGNVITLHYDASHRLQRIEGQNNHAVDITRDSQGRITAIQDELGRTVQYGYSGNGQLSTVTDLGGNAWSHQYTNGRLHQVFDPLGNEAVWVSYDPDGRARQTRLYQDQHQFRYDGAVTEVRDAAGNTSTFSQNAAGITTRVVNAQGFVSELELDDHNRVTGLRHQGEQRAAYQYDEHGNLANVRRLDDTGEVSYDHRFDLQGRVIEISGSDGTRTGFTWDDQGKLIERDDNGAVTRYAYNSHGDRLREEADGAVAEYTYNADGLLTLLQRGPVQASFDYDPAGRLTAIAFPGGNTHDYRYDALGLRTRTTRSDGGYKYYRYDSTGNLVRGGGTEHSGQYVSQALTLDDDNKVLEAEFANDSSLRLEYDTQGNPTLLDWGNRTLACSYDPQGRLVKVEDSSGGLSEYSYQPGEPDIRRQWDTRVGATLSEKRRESPALQTQAAARYARPAGTPWPGLAWNPSLVLFDLPQEEGLVLPDALAQAAEQRRHLLHTLATDPAMQGHFAMPSNSFFLPPEYVSVNCWLPGCWISGVSLSVPATVTVGQATSMTTSISVKGPDCFSVIYDWYIDGQYAGSGFGGYSHSITPTIQTAGSHTVTTHSYCICDMYPIVRTKNFQATCEAPSNPPPRPSWTRLVETPNTIVINGEVYLGRTRAQSGYNFNDETNPNKPTCTQYCQGNTLVWKIKGGLEITQQGNSSNLGKLASVISQRLILANGSTIPRLSNYKDFTLGHELTHASAVELDLRDTYHSTLNGTYSNLPACVAALAIAKADFQDEFADFFFSGSHPEFCHSTSNWVGDHIWSVNTTTGQEQLSATVYTTNCEPGAIGF